MKVAFFCILSFLCFPTLLLAQRKPDMKGAKQKIELEGLSVAGLPLLFYNDDLGLLSGARIVSTYYQKEYKPYRYHFWTQYLISSLNYVDQAAHFDYISLSDLRWRITAGRKKNTLAKYYGYGNAQDIPMIHRITGEQDPVIAVGPNLVRHGIDPDFDSERLKDSQNRYYSYYYETPYLDSSLDFWLGQSKFKCFLGYLAHRYTIRSYHNQVESGEIEANILGYVDLEQPVGYDAVREDRAKSVTYLRMALVYDSRPRETKNSPNTGIFTDIHYEASDKSLGSDYNYSNLTLTWRQYISLFPSLWGSIGMQSVFSYRLMARETLGGTAPFFEAGKVRNVSETAEGLGGEGGVRGFPYNQFIDKFITIANFELRHTFLQSEVWGGMDFQFLYFYDLGRVASSSKKWQTKDFHKAYGLGSGVVWQKNLVGQLLFGFSEFDRYTALSLRHTF